MVMVSHAHTPSAPSAGHGNAQAWPASSQAGHGAGAAHGRGERKQEKEQRPPGTPSRREERHKEKAVQDPGLKDYVSATNSRLRSASFQPHKTGVFVTAGALTAALMTVEERCLRNTADNVLATRRMSRKRCLRVCVQSFQLGNGRGGGYKTD